MIPKSEDASMQQNKQLVLATILKITTNFTTGMQRIIIMKGEFRVYQKTLEKHRY